MKGLRAIGILALTLAVAGVAWGADLAYRQNLRARDSQLLFIHGEVSIGAGGQVSSTAGPEVFSAARTTTGQYTVVFGSPGIGAGAYALDGGTNLTLFNNSAFGYSAIVKSSTPSTGTIVLVTSSAGSLGTKKSLPSGSKILIEKRWNLSIINP